MTGLTIAAVQSNSRRGEVEENVAHHIELIEVAAGNGADIVVFPELSLIGYEIDIAADHELKPIDDVLSPLQEATDRLGVHILVGAPYRSAAGLHIAAFYYSPDEKPQVYTKHFVHVDESPYFVSGTQDLTIRLRGEVISPAICYDVSNPEHAAQAAAKGTTVYAAGVMTMPRGYPAKAQSMEKYTKQYNMAAILANYAGPSGGDSSAGKSAAWDREGNLLAVAPDEGEAIVLLTLGENPTARVVIVP